MCGIAGFYSLSNSPAQEEAEARRILAGMADAIRHRGPDDGGVYVDGPVGLKPKGIGYAFADERLEGLTAAQKQLLRTGPRNVRIIKERLRRIALALGIPADQLPSE